MANIPIERLETITNTLERLYLYKKHLTALQNDGIREAILTIKVKVNNKHNTYTFPFNTSYMSTFLTAELAKVDRQIGTAEEALRNIVNS